MTFQYLSLTVTRVMRKCLLTRWARPQQLSWRRVAAGRLVIAASVAFSLAAAGCSSGESVSDAGTNPSTTKTARATASSSPSSVVVAASTTTTVGSTETSGVSAASSDLHTEIVDRYIGFWTARMAANSSIPNPDDPALAEFATGEQLGQVRSETKANLDQGLALKAAANPTNFQRVTVVSVEGDHAVVQECVVDDAVVIRREGGEVVNESVTTQNVRGELDRVDGRWRVSRVVLVQQWEGVAGCANGS